MFPNKEEVKEGAGEELAPVEQEQGMPKAPAKEMPKVRKNGIEVVALRKGFYNNLRIKPGDKFKVQKESELGEWMKCVNPEEEKKRVEIFKAKKKKQAGR